MDFVFSSNTKAELIKKGWYPNRQVSTLSIKNCALEAGYSWFDKADEFLSAFSGLRISSNWLDTPNTINFDVQKSIKVVDPLWVTQDYSLRIKKTLFCPIGLAYSEHLLLFMSNDGYVYGGFDEELLCIASCGAQAIENILAGNFLNRIA